MNTPTFDSDLPPALLIGVVTGLRSMTSLAAVSWAAQRGTLDLKATPFAFLAFPAATGVLGLLAAGELIADKLPIVPSRKAPLSFLGRVGIGALCGALLCAPTKRMGSGFLAGAAGAVLGTEVGYEFRARLVKAVGGMDFPVAFLEDALAIVTAVKVVSRKR
ncbi:MAG TPA: DUF4126 family protein [Chthoniobacterales bacterium]